jgi:hypothetical protein
VTKFDFSSPIIFKKVVGFLLLIKILLVYLYMEKIVLFSRDKGYLKLDIKKYSQNEWKCGQIRKSGNFWTVELIKNI